MSARGLLVSIGGACALLTLATLSGCVVAGGYGGGYAYDDDYYYGPDAGVYGTWGPGYYVGPGHFHGAYSPRPSRGEGRAPAFRGAAGGHSVPSLPLGGGGGGGHGGGGGGHGGGGGGGGHGGGGGGHGR